MTRSPSALQHALFDSGPIEATAGPVSSTALSRMPPSRPGKASDRAAGPGLLAMSEQFLNHLAVGRRCSPRTIEAYRNDYGKLARYLQDAGQSSAVCTLTTGDLQLCVANLSHLSSASIERLIYALRSLFKYLVRQGILDGNPAEGLDLPQHGRTLPKSLGSDAYAHLWRACQTDLERLVVGGLGLCGLRRAELLDTNIVDIAADLSAVRVEGKGRRQRVVPIHESVRPLLASHLASLSSSCPALLRNHADARMSPTSLRRLFGRIVERADLAEAGITPHTLRHHFASELLRCGADVATVAELLGHSNISTTSIYLHSSPERRREAVALLPALPNGRDAVTDTPHHPPDTPLDECGLQGGRGP